ncbi:MAG: large subunit ribosomal protein L17, partial [Microgenomates group bacterium Gr01-1014_80]
MRHRVYGKHLGRNKDERTALFKNLVQALIIHGSIETTETKARAIKGLVDKIINQAKSKNTQRLLQSFLNSKEIREKLVKEIAPNMKGRNSGYTSVVKLGQRKGDNAMLVRMSLLVEESKKMEVKGKPEVVKGKEIKTR